MKMDKTTAIELLTAQAEATKALQRSPQGDRKRWHLDTIACLERVFGKDSRQLKEFKRIRWSPMVTWLGDDNSGAYQSAQANGLRNAVSVLESALNEVQQFWELDRAEPQTTVSDALRRIERMCERFHGISRRLRQRHDNRPTLEVTDEYDVQDLIHPLLLLDFDDVRPEEWAPSYAGAASRMDFLLKREQIVLEAKKTRPGLTARMVGEELLVDCQRYKTHPDCKMLVCFVYDPEGLLANPRGLENDLATAGGEMPMRVYIRP